MERSVPAARLGARRSRPARAARPTAGPFAIAGRSLRAAGRALYLLAVAARRALSALVRAARRHPRWAAALAATLAVLGVAYLVVRHSSLSAVRRVQVQGVSGMDAGAIESSLIAAAQRQSTLGVDVGALQAAVAQYHLVSALHVSASFPHTLRIVVSEQLPVATLRNGTQTAVVAADGAVLDPSVASGAAPTIDVASLPSGRVSDPQLLADLAVLGAAPPVMLHRVSRIYPGPNGITVAMRNGLVIFFGDTHRPHAKWISAMRVIASPLSAGATYVDVRVPEHPAAGGMANTTGTTNGTLSTDATDASIAAALAAALNGTGGAGSTSATPGTGAGVTGAGATGTATGAGAGTAAQAPSAAATPTSGGAASGTGPGAGQGGASSATGAAATGTAGGGTAGGAYGTSTGGGAGAIGAGTAAGAPASTGTGAGYTSTGG